jgi:hypothetical protein
VPSRGGVGSAYDNALAESFVATLKTELLYRSRWPGWPAAGIHPGARRAPVLLNHGEPGDFDIAPWTPRVLTINAKYAGTWELPVLGRVAAPAAVLIRPDGYIAWVGDGTDTGLRDALTIWFGPPDAASLTTAATRLPEDEPLHKKSDRAKPF